jgi:hypothetical protein
MLSFALQALQSIPLARVLTGAAAGYGAAMAVLLATEAPLGSPVFFATAAVMMVAYAVMLARIWRHGTPTRLLMAALACAVLFRAPAALAPVSSDSDMIRYIWDGRVQHLGYNPYRVLPADPAMAHTHTPETAAMPSRRHRTPYPPAAQLFFRLVVGVHDSPLMMKLALLASDLLTILIVWRWLAASGRNEWLVLAYAWHPLVVIEVAHGGHMDALGAMWIAASAYWLSRRRTGLATIACVLAVATKLLPLVLAPLFIGRIRIRDGLAGATLLVLLYGSYMYGAALPLGAVPNVVEHIRFNGPLFRTLAAVATPRGAAAAAVGLGLLVAMWARFRLDRDDPAAWAWPMAVALACAPVIYPWYLLYLTPFLFTVETLPLVVWTFSVLPVYIVWHLATLGGRWVVPRPVLIGEYAVALGAAVLVVLTRRSRKRERLPANVSAGHG